MGSFLELQPSAFNSCFSAGNQTAAYCSPQWREGESQNLLCADGQKAHEKMLNITNYYGKANQNYNEVSPHTGHHQMAIIKNSTKNKCWRGYGEKGTLLSTLTFIRM